MGARILLALLFFNITSLFAQTDVTIRFLLGDVEVKKVSNTEGWQKASLNMPLEEKDLVRTLSESICEIEFSAGATTKLLENSILEIKNIPQAEEENASLFTGLGKFYFDVRKFFFKSFRVESPSAVAAIRGTQFLLSNGPDKSEIMVARGQVQYSGLDEENIITVSKNQKSSISVGEPPQPPVVLTEADIQLIQQAARSLRKGPKKELHETGKPNGYRSDDSQPQSPQAPSPGPASDKEPSVEQTETEEKKYKGGIAIGAVTIGDEIYNQIGIRPEFAVGKLGIALDLSLYIDKDGNIRKENWDDARDFFEKIYYVRWGQPNDPFYTKVGAIDNYRLGFGILMNRYSNTVEYPRVIRTGAEFAVNKQNAGFQGMINDFGEFTDGGGLMAGRLSYKVLGDLEIGGSVVFDRNQYKALNDDDDDGVPDYLDAFPNNRKYSVDSDNDKQPDETDFDRDGDGFTDNKEYLIRTGLDTTLINDQDYLADPLGWQRQNLDSEPFNINKAKEKSQLALALDLSYPILRFEYLNLIAYGQWAKFPHTGGWGITAPGFLAKFAFINAFAEYR
ncbi:MAG: hypothetical protein GF313_03155, partial [Caldithrix sp.]|nr:hypothetical protein [Caldithrix sp.]